MSWEDIKIFREYLQIKTAAPTIDFEPVIEFIGRQAKSLDLPMKIYYPSGPTQPIVVITWAGTDPKLESIVLNSHMDTVPADPEFWTYPPYEAVIDGKGRIIARGTQDMKSMPIQYFAAIRELKLAGITNPRTFHVIFAPDEEMGGTLGWAEFVKTDDFKALNVGFHLDEGSASPFEDTYLYNGERTVWRFALKIIGTAGHGSLLLENTAGEKLYRILEKYLIFRNSEAQKLIDNPELTIGDVTTVNLTIINGGDQINVVPPVIVAQFDMRIAMDMPLSQMDEEINSWIRDGGDDIELSFMLREEKIESTPVGPENKYSVALTSAIIESGYSYNVRMRNGASDGRFLREIGIPSLGFAPMPHTEVLLHANDEYINADTFLSGIEVYKNIIVKLGKDY